MGKGTVEKEMVRIIRRIETDFAEKVIRVSGFEVMVGKETSPGIAFIGCPERYFLFQVCEKGGTRFYKGQSEPCMGDSVV